MDSHCSLSEPQDLAVFYGEPLHHLSFILGHVQHLLSLCVLVGRRPRHKGGALSTILLPDFLCLGGCEKSGEEVPHVRMTSTLKNTSIGRMCDHGLDDFSMVDGCAGHLRPMNETLT